LESDAHWIDELAAMVVYNYGKFLGITLSRSWNCVDNTNSPLSFPFLEGEYSSVTLVYPAALSRKLWKSVGWCYLIGGVF